MCLFVIQSRGIMGQLKYNTHSFFNCIYFLLLSGYREVGSGPGTGSVGSWGLSGCRESLQGVWRLLRARGGECEQS